jgi:hypothetical protein
MSANVDDARLGRRLGWRFRLCILSVAKTAGLDVAVNSAFIAAFAAFATSNSSLMLTI